MIRVAFCLQGEGNGHITQAISLAELIDPNYYELVVVLAGSKSGQVSGLISNSFNCPVEPFYSPGLEYDEAELVLSLRKTIFRILRKLFIYVQSIIRIEQHLKKYEADVVINFYEPLSGISNFIHNYGRRKFIAVAHQFYLTEYILPQIPGNWTNRIYLNLVNRLCSLGACEIWALSFGNYHKNRNKLRITPPLIRSKFRERFGKQASKQNVVIYLTKPGAIERIFHEHLNFKNFNFIVYSSFKSADLEKYQSVNLHLKISGSNDFYEDFINARILISTCGFETLCESAYLHKIHIAIPMSNHFEQYCNSIDAGLSAIARIQYEFDLEIIRNMDREGMSNSKNHFVQWVNSGQFIYNTALNSLLIESSKDPYPLVPAS